jgi:ABC-type multidrug transport system ATPase subunit
VIRELAATGISVLITDHAAREILQITDRTYVVSEGRILCSGTADQIVAHPEVRQKYLGDIEIPATAVDSANGTTFKNAVQQNAVQQLPPPLSTPRPHTNSAPVVPSPHLKFPTPAERVQSDVASLKDAAIQNVASNSGDVSSASKLNPPSVDANPVNGIPTPASPIPNRPRSRKVVAPFKSTDLD